MTFHVLIFTMKLYVFVGESCMSLCSYMIMKNNMSKVVINL